MKPVTIYTTDHCGYCVRAKSLLAQKQVPFVEVDVSDDDEKRRWLVEATGRRTVPQIFIGDQPIGGHDDLVALMRSGQLDALLVAGA